MGRRPKLGSHRLQSKRKRLAVNLGCRHLVVLSDLLYFVLLFFIQVDMDAHPILPFLKETHAHI